MEIKAELKKPYTDKERMDFIVEQNHKNGYTIEETDNALLAWGLSNEEKQTENLKQFNTEFFNTSLGYIRRKVTMKDGTTKDFLSDIVPLLQTGVKIITYSILNGEITQNTNVTVTEEFISECKQQVLKDFYGAETTVQSNNQ